MKINLIKKVTLLVIVILCFSACSMQNEQHDKNGIVYPSEGSSANYDLSSITVMIKKEYSEFGKEYSPSDFDKELIESVEVINQINPGDDTSGFDLNYWQQILSLELKEPSEENVQKAIAAAYRNPQVQTAHENIIYTMEME